MTKDISPRRTNSQSNNYVAYWLLLICTAIFIMLILGGVTRLTHSGLSIVEWKPISGILPPLNSAQWQEAFDQYKQYPEYQLNPNMDLSGFKSIYWLEYIHRIWGRLIGLIFLIPFIYFLFKKQISKNMLPKYITMFVLGGLQGLMGWYMVKSGLIKDPHVSQYRLTAHLALAFIIFAYIYWTALALLFSSNNHSAYISNGLKRMAYFATALISITVISGGFVAGLKAGFGYNTFPLMDGKIIPDGLFALEPWYRNFFDNIMTVQFDHRILAISTVIFIFVLWWKSKRYDISYRAKLSLNALAVMATIQAILGILTLLLVVPTSLATIHQAGALVLFTLALNVNYFLLVDNSTKQVDSNIIFSPKKNLSNTI